MRDRLKEFTTDGCSGGMSWLVNAKELPWRGVCIRHDVEYWVGGTAADRKKADINLLRGVADNEYPIIGFLMYLAVRVGGHPIFPFSWRWGYGYNYPRSYKIRDDKEREELRKNKWMLRS